jgi:hypothetical protein
MVKCEKWQAYLNVDDSREICDGDRLMIVSKPSKVLPFSAVPLQFVVGGVHFALRGS